MKARTKKRLRSGSQPAKANGSGPEAGRESGQRILLVGLQPPPGGEPAPLYPYPLTSWGGRVAAMTGLEPDAYLETFDRTYAISQPPKNRRASYSELREGADRILDEFKPGARVILLGRQVAIGFGVDWPWHTWQPCGYVTRCRMAVVPAPSHAGNWYADAKNRTEALRFWRAIAARARACTESGVKREKSVHFHLCCNNADRPVSVCNQTGDVLFSHAPEATTCERCLRDPIFWQARIALALEAIARRAGR